MSQHDYDIANQAGAAFRTDLNSALAAIVSNNSGATAPSTTFAYQWWADTTTGLLKIRNAANSAWVTVGTLASANLGLATLASPTFTGTVTIPTVAIAAGTVTGITDLAIADGGTGASTAAAAFAALKQAATSSATGVVELATDAEAQAGTDATRCVTPDNLGAVVLGLGQAYTDVTASRASGVTYTNSTGRSIIVSAWGTTGGITNQRAQCYVGGVLVADNSWYANGAGYTANAYFLVPPGATYSITFSNVSSITKWFELR